MRKVFKILRRRIFLILAVIILFGIGASFFLRNGNGTEFFEVKKVELLQAVEAAGTTKPAQSVDLAFEKSGTVRTISAKVGDTVAAGAALASLDLRELSADLLEAEAKLDAEQAKLDELKKGTRPEEILIEENKVESARISLENSKRNLIDTVGDAFTKSDDAIRNKVDQFIVSPLSSSPQLSFSADPVVESKIERGRLSIETLLISWKASLEDPGLGETIAADVARAKDGVTKVKELLDQAALALSSLTQNSSLSQTTIDKYRSDVATARTNVGTAASNIQAAEEKFNNAKAAFTIAENELVLKKAGTVPEQVLAQTAKVKEAQARVLSIQSQIQKSVLRSPIAGTVAKQDAKVGQIAPANTTLISIISASNFEIEANIPEINVGSVAAENPVRITFDAFPGEEFEGMVLRIDPSETLVNGVVNFKTTVALKAIDPRMRSGLTSNLVIETGKKEGVLAVPRFAVSSREDHFYVMKKKGKDAVPTTVTLGVSGRGGLVEITSGLSEGDLIATNLSTP